MQPHPSLLLAGLWRDADLTHHGRWHGAIISGLIQDHDLFYAQWHDAPHVNDPDLTARHAIAIVLNSNNQAWQPLAGHAFFIYDNISDIAGTVAQGYTIGIEDKLGLRGVTHAYAPCCSDPRTPIGYPPDSGTTLHLQPVLFGRGKQLPAHFHLQGYRQRPGTGNGHQHGRRHQQLQRPGIGPYLVHPLPLPALADVHPAAAC